MSADTRRRVSAPFRGSVDEDSDRVDPLKALVYRGLYVHRDPFGPQAIWIRQLLEDAGDESFEEEPPRPNVAAQWAEDARRLKLAEESRGHEIWYRGRQQGADLLTPAEADEVREVKGKIAQAISGPPRSSVKPAMQPQRHWFRVRRALPPSASVPDARDGGGGATGSTSWPAASMLAPVGDGDDPTRTAARLNSSQSWCWRYDFVQEALMAAKGFGLRCCTITEFSRGTRHLKEREGYVEAVSSAGGRELWSPSFLNVLEALRARWDLTQDSGLECVRLSERELQRRYPDLRFEEPRDFLAELRPATIPMPRTLARKLKEIGPPVPPPLPQRLPCRVFYDHDLPWTRKGVKPEVRELKGTASLPSLFGRTSSSHSGRGQGMGDTGRGIGVIRDDNDSEESGSDVYSWGGA